MGIMRLSKRQISEAMSETIMNQCPSARFRNVSYAVHSSSHAHHTRALIFIPSSCMHGLCTQVGHFLRPDSSYFV